MSEVCKPWWECSKIVEPYMTEISNALDRSGLAGHARVDVYNRAYEAIYKALVDAGVIKSE